MQGILDIKLKMETQARQEFAQAKLLLDKEEEQLELLKSFYEAYTKAMELVDRHYQFCLKQILAEIPEFLKENKHQLNHVVQSFMTNLRGAVLEEAIRQGYLTYDEEKDNRMLGVYLYV